MLSHLVTHITRRGVVACALSVLFAFCSSATPAIAIDRKVLIIGIDGLRPDAMLTADAPAIDSLIANGAVSYEAMAEDITISGPGWSSVLTGVHRNKHGVTGNSFVGSNYTQYPTFLQRLEESCEISTASIVKWSPINVNIVQTHADVLVTGVPDATVATSAANLLSTADPDVLFIAFDDVDGAGHSSGFSTTSAGYLAAINRTDTYVAQVLTAMRARATYANEDWLIIVITDHGGTPDGTHGRNIPEHRLTPFIVSGASAARGTITGDVAIVDVAATVFTFLGLPINPAWDWDSVPRGLNLAGSTSQPFVCTPPPPPPLGACCLSDGSCTQQLAGACNEARGLWLGLNAACTPPCPILTRVFAENFDAQPLGPSLDETPAGTAVWTNTPPTGWTVDNSTMPTGGVREWRGWSFASPSWWSQVAADQGRSGFTKGRGVIAIADPDEWFDLPRGAGQYTTHLSTPTISLAGVRAQTARLILDSSWLPESPQTARITAQFDSGSPVTLLDWSSDPGPTFKDNAPNETLSISLQAPAGAQSVVLTFSMPTAQNNWWWAIDNIEVVGEPLVARATLLSETFEALVLGPSLFETPAQPAVWTQTPPAGWMVDDSGVPTINNPASGMKEWEGWAFTSKSWWTSVAGDQNRSQFTRASGTIAVADPDEWDDRGSPAPSSLGPFNARMATRTIPLRGIRPNSIQIDFDSSWRPEGLQRAELSANLGAGASINLLRWNSAAGPDFKPDATNERVQLLLNNPPGSSSITLNFALLDARNNWWWAIDNLSITAALSCPCDVNNDGLLAVADIFEFLSNWFASNNADFDGDGATNVADIFRFLECFFATTSC
jgi:Type I phosphodiesterase / nucleotide pyrophosphatase